jgi:phosphopantothenoylcysteine synthetase/decarboxylase
MTDNGTSTFGGRLLIGATGSGAVASLPMYISALRSQFTGTVTVLMTHTATTFLPAHTVGLFADQVITGESPATWPHDNHVSMAAGHDMLAVLPATANMLSATATGAVPNLLSATIMQATIPVVFFPVMSGDMWQKRSVQRNVDQLREDGYRVVDPAWGPRYDVGLGAFVDSPMPPAPPRFIEVIRELMPMPQLTTAS